VHFSRPVQFRSGRRLEPRDDRRGIYRIESNNDAEGEHYDANRTTAAEQATDKTAIRPFQFNFRMRNSLICGGASTPQMARARIVSDASQGVQLATMQKLARYWGIDYDWRKGEGNKGVPHFITGIDGLDIHFIHVRSKHENALPIIVTHGWPGSVIEQLKIIEPLTTPQRTAVPGRCFPSGNSVAAGLRLLRQADRARLEPGQHRQGVGDADATPRLHKVRGTGWRLGQCISEMMALQQPPGLLGIHTNMAATVPPMFLARWPWAAAAGRPFAGGKVRLGRA